MTETKKTDNRQPTTKVKPGKKMIWTATVAVLVIAVLCTVILYISGASIVEQRSVVRLAAGANYDTLLDSLSAGGGKLTNIDRFRRFARLMKLEESVKPGRYELRPGMTAKAVVSMFRSGNQSPVNVTFNNIRTLEELAGRIGAQIEADSAVLAAKMLEDGTAEKYGFKKEEFIGMFIPDTYQVYWTISPEKFLDRMKREYDRFWSGARAEKLESLGMTVKQVSALASIVDEETNRESEMPTIAGVYINRLSKGMYLQADPTVKFAMGNPALQRVLRKHLETDSPYNTYRNKGLPPGPIRMPSVQAIDAVLDHQRHDYLFFCAKGDFSGYHAFAKTLEEHNKNARAYSRALNSAGIR